MRFAFTDDQLALRDAVRDLLTRRCPPEVVRTAWPEDAPEGAGARHPDGWEAAGRVWASLAEMGVLSVAVPEARGGLGLSELDWVLLAEESGYAALPFPLVETAAVVAPLLAELDGPDGLIEGVCDGTTVATARLVGDGPVPYGQWADVALLVSDDGDDVPALVLAHLRSGQVHPVRSVDGSRALAEIGWISFEPLTSAATALDRAVRRGTLGTAAELIGLARRMLDLTVAYVGQRRQFGVPVGSFQAVKHHLADARLELEFAAPAVHRAAWSLATGDASAGRDVAMAKAMASSAAELVGRQALQCHGAIGYTVEHDLHLYLKRAWALARDWGDVATHRATVADSLGI